MFMDFSYVDMKIWYWMPESSFGYFLGRPIYSMLFGTIYIAGSTVFYLWVKKFFKKDIHINKRGGKIFILISILLFILLSLLKLPAYTRYLPIFTIFVSGIFMLVSKKFVINEPGMLATILTTMVFSIVWNNIARIYGIYDWHRESIFGYIFGMPFDEYLFAILVTPTIIITYTSLDSLTHKSIFQRFKELFIH
jgi:hypothetical protein